MNGGIFDQHQIEIENTEIKIPDKAFEGLFDFFDHYTWHLDDRPLRNDQEINPDVLGYIFEKYINQKQMGAYYTKEDITEYISKNTIIPYLFEEAARRNTEPFQPDREVWQLLRDDPDRYIYNAVGHGVFVNVHTGDELDSPIVLPGKIAAGITDFSQRTEWNSAAPPELALPTETWREHIARRQRCINLRQKLANGEVASINDMVTYNLDIRQFAQDVIDNCESPDLLRAIYYTIAGRPTKGGSNHKLQLPLSVLDPTCGSGAFLFAALNIMQPLYEACLAKMEQFIIEVDRAQPLTADDEVAALIEMGESNTLEFKSTARFCVKLSKTIDQVPKDKHDEKWKAADKGRQHDILKAVSALLNTNGGDLVIGVDDKGVGFGIHHDYRFLGPKEKQNRDQYELWMNKLFIDQFGKTAAGCIEFVPAKRDGLDVVWLKITPSPDPVFVNKPDGTNVFYRRIGNATQQLDMMEFAKYRDQRFKGEPSTRKQPKLKLAAPQKSEGKKLKDFRDVLAEVSQHPNRTYFVLKSIIINNLFGVDIMPEAVEICKLRLFLKLMSTVQPHYSKANLGVEALPDIDFNIRPGNTLVGYTTLTQIERSLSQTLGFENDQLKSIQKQVKIVSLNFEMFRRQQTELDGNIKELDKKSLREELRTLTEELDEFLACEYGAESTKPKKFKDWKESHKPFHWFAEFYGIMSGGGFNCVVGNPPYVEYSTVKDVYSVRDYKTMSCGNLYAMSWERCLAIISSRGRTGLIVPVASVCTDGYQPLQQILIESGSVFVSNFNDRPSKLFDGLEHIRLSVILHHNNTSQRELWSTRYNKWQAEERELLFKQLSFVNVSALGTAGSIAKIGSELEEAILRKYLAEPKTIADYVGTGIHEIHYTRKLSHFIQVLDFIPRIEDEQGNVRPPSELKTLRFHGQDARDAFLCLLNSSLFYWLITVLSDCRNLNKREIFSARFSLEKNSRHVKELGRLARDLMGDIQCNSKMQSMSYKKFGTLRIQCTFPKLSKRIIDEIDQVLSNHFNLTDSEVDFIMNFDAKYRLGVEELDD